MAHETLRLEAHGRGYRMRWPVAHEGDQAAGKIANCMRDGRPYEQPLLEHIYQQRFVGLAVDAGANIGNHTLWFAAVCGLRVVAYEPIWTDQLRANVELNKLDGRVTIEPVALGVAEGVAIRQGRGRLVPDGTGHSPPGPNRFPVRTLDSFDLTGVALIKIDVEGMEAAVLRGGETTIRRDRPVIFVEEWGGAERNTTAAVLEPWGYTAGQVFRGTRHAAPVRRWDPRVY